MTKVAFAELETASGFRANKHGIALSEALIGHLDFPDIVNFDWVHSALQGGVVNCEVEALLVATGTKREDLQTFLADPKWEYPGASRHRAKALHRVFDKRRVGTEEPDKIRATCAELLGLYGMLRCFFALKHNGNDSYRQQINCFFLLCAALDLLLAMKFGIRKIDAGSVGELQAMLSRHLHHHIAIYGERYIRPKHHWLLDCPGQFLRDMLILDAFVIERSHLQIKTLAEHVDNTITYERSVLSSLFCSTFQQGEDLGDRLIGRTAVLPGTAAVLADRCTVLGCDFAVDELVVHGGTVAQLKAVALEADELIFVVQPLRPVGTALHKSGMYEVGPDVLVWPAQAVAHALAWRRRTDAQFFVVLR